MNPKTEHTAAVSARYFSGAVKISGQARRQDKSTYVENTALPDTPSCLRTSFRTKIGSNVCCRGFCVVNSTDPTSQQASAL
jgi:hypothetical protein